MSSNEAAVVRLRQDFAEARDLGPQMAFSSLEASKRNISLCRTACGTSAKERGRFGFGLGGQWSSRAGRAFGAS